MNYFDVLLAKVLGGGGGTTPTGSISITQNGKYDVTAYAEANVSLPDGSEVSY